MSSAPSRASPASLVEAPHDEINARNHVADTRPGPEPAERRASLGGLWKDGERQVVSRVSKASDGTWSGVVVSSPRREELGKTTFHKLVYDEKRRAFTGQLRRPDADQVIDVVVTFDSALELKAEAKVFIFSKTLRFTKQAEEARH